MPITKCVSECTMKMGIFYILCHLASPCFFIFALGEKCKGETDMVK